MIIHLIAVGRVRNAALREACAVYAKRLTRYQRYRLVEVREGGRRDADAEVSRRAEADALRRAAPAGARLVALTRLGDPCSSTDLARRLDTWRRGARDVAVLIGGAHGLHRGLLQDAETRLSLSALTLPHDLARLVFLEQLYRAGTILRGEPYHKGGA